MRRRTRRRIIAGVPVGAAFATFLASLTVPVPQHFSMHGAAIYDLETTCTGIDTTGGTTVSFHWSALSPIYFFVVSCSANQVAYQANGTQGLGAFVSSGGVYELGASRPGLIPCVPADVSGSYTGPLLAL